MEAEIPPDSAHEYESEAENESMADAADQVELEGRISEYRWDVPGSPPSHKESSDGAETVVGIFSLVPLPARGRLVAVGGDEMVHILQMSTETEVNADGFLQGIVEEVEHELKKVHTDSIATAAITDDQSCLALGGLDGRVSIYSVNKDTAQLALVNVFEEASNDIEYVTFAPNSSAVLATTHDGQAICWHALRGFVSLTANHKGAVRCGRFVKIRQTPAIVTIGEDGYLCVSNPQTSACTHRVLVEKSNKAHEMAEDESSGEESESARGILSLDILDDQQSPLALCGCASGAVVIVNYETGHVVKRLPLMNGVVEAVAFAPSESRPIFNDQYIAASDDTGSIAFTTLSSDVWRNRVDFEIKDPHEQVSVTHLRWTRPNVHDTVIEAKIVAAASNGLIKVFDCRNGQMSDCLSADQQSICSLELIKWTDDLTIVACGTDEGSVLFWQLD